jgi:hypothetical protein
MKTGANSLQRKIDVMWMRHIDIPMNRNITDLNRVETAWDWFNDDVGWLSGREVVMIGMSLRGKCVRVTFADHREWCDVDCDNKPASHLKYKIRSLWRRHR